MPVSSARVDFATFSRKLEAAGGSVSESELKELKELAKTAAPGDRSKIEEVIDTLESLRSHARSQNDAVKSRAKGLAAEEKEILTPGTNTTSFGGSPVPEAVKKALNAMLAAGATVYDVSELSTKPSIDDHAEAGAPISEKYTVTGKWTPYPQDITAMGPMAFAYTELTPKKIADDMSTVRDQKVLAGYDSHTQTNRATGETMSWQTPKYETKRMAGTGNIEETYDEASHSEMYALGQASQGYPKFSANFAILADGSFHAVPAMRRTPESPNLILTNPSLARGKRMLFNGHIGMQNGVVTSIGLSGRLQKLAADGEGKFVDPVKLLEAWGFKMSPNLKVSFEGSGNIKVDPSTNLIVAG
jgi:hypothetical protein